MLKRFELLLLGWTPYCEGFLINHRSALIINLLIILEKYLFLNNNKKKKHCLYIDEEREYV